LQRLGAILIFHRAQPPKSTGRQCYIIGLKRD
jgi:hypothetical protein